MVNAIGPYWASLHCVVVPLLAQLYKWILLKNRSMKDLLYGVWGDFSCRARRLVPSGQDGALLPARAANHSARFGSSCWLTEPAIK